MAFAIQIKDLRSQIARESCITLAFLSHSFGNRLELFIEQQMANLIVLLQNSAKVMATSGLVALRFVIENTHSARLIPFITNGIESRSKEIRRACCESLNQMLMTWDSGYFDKHLQAIQVAIKKGIADADPDARVLARKAFWSLNSHYPAIADALLNTLDPKTKKLLQTGSQGTFGSVKSLKDGSTNLQQQQQQSATSINYDFMDSQNNRLQKMSNNTNNTLTSG